MAGAITSGIMSGAITTGAISINDNNGNNMITFDTTGYIKTPYGDISVKEWINITQLMKRIMMDVANDSELSKRLPYVKEAAYDWVVEELRK